MLGESALQSLTGQCLKCLVDLGGVRAATLCEVRLAAATTAKNLGSATDQITSLDALLACRFVGCHGDHGLAVLVHAGKSHHDRSIFAELAAHVEHGLAQRVEGAEMSNVLLGDLDRSRGSFGLSHQRRHRGRKLGLVHCGKTTVGFLELGKQHVHTLGEFVGTGVEMAADQGVKVDEAKFRELMAEQKSRARADALKKRHNVDLSVYDDFKKTLLQPIDFLGYTDMSARAKVLGIMQEGKGSVPAVTGPANIEVILDRTPFYAQAGGQLADQGEILSDDGAVLEVDDVQKPIKDLIVHQCRLTEGTLVVGAEVNANIDLERRGAIARSHTATHMVHKALREELGPQATQRGSEDAPNRLRFDFQWSSAPSKDAMNAVEARVNEKLRENLAVTTQEMKFDDAIALGAMHLFGEKYGDIVRVVSIGEDGWSRELCGGTHIDHVGKIGAINIMSEASIGSGVRRVDAVVGQGAYEFNAREHALVSQLSDMVNARPDELAERVNMLLAKLKESDRRLAAMYESQLAASVPTLVAEAKASSAPVKVAKKNVGHFGSFDALRKTVLDVRGQLGEDAPVVVALAGMNEDGKPMVAVATNEAARKQGIKAGDLVRGASKVLGGGGGGKPDFAQGGGADATKIDEALEALAGQALKG